MGSAGIYMINEALETHSIFDVSLSGTEGDTEMPSVQSVGVCFFVLFPNAEQQTETQDPYTSNMTRPPFNKTPLAP